MSTKTNRYGLPLLASACVAALFGVVPGAGAAVITYNITSDHCTGTNGCIPIDGASAGTITITDTAANTVSVAVDLNSGYGIVNGGFDASFGFNLAGNPTITNYTLTTPASGFTLVSTTAGSLHMDGTGFFEYGLDCTVGGGACTGPGGGGAYFGPLDFSITASGLSTSSFEANADGQFFALDVIGPNGNTGGVDASSTIGPPVRVSEPGSLAMLGGSLATMGLFLRRRKVTYEV